MNLHEWAKKNITAEAISDADVISMDRANFPSRQMPMVSLKSDCSNAPHSLNEESNRLIDDIEHIYEDSEGEMTSKGYRWCPEDEVPKV